MHAFPCTLSQTHACSHRLTHTYTLSQTHFFLIDSYTYTPLYNNYLTHLLSHILTHIYTLPTHLDVFPHRLIQTHSNTHFLRHSQAHKLRAHSQTHSLIDSHSDSFTHSFSYTPCTHYHRHTLVPHIVPFNAHAVTCSLSCSHTFLLGKEEAGVFINKVPKS